jgi:hypothetical protein
MDRNQLASRTPHNRRHTRRLHRTRLHLHRQQETQGASRHAATITALVKTGFG